MAMTKVVINSCYGGFSLSTEAVLLAQSMDSSEEWASVDPAYGYYDGPRTNGTLIQVVEQLGTEKASGSCAKLTLYELAKGTLYRIDDYDGFESIKLNEDTYWEIA